MADDSDPGRLLLGMCGWPHPDWRDRYFPHDLPQDWEFAYYSNEASCLLLAPDEWLALEQDQLAEWCDECAPWFRFYLEDPGPDLVPERLSAFGSALGGVLVRDAGRKLPPEVPAWQLDPEGGRWVERRTGAVLNRWNIAGEDLRALKARLQTLPDRSAAVLIEGDGVLPDSLRELHTLAELLGVA